VRYYKERFTECLEKFRDLTITKQELYEFIARQQDTKCKPINITNLHLINLLMEYKNGRINERYILDWVNTVWFTDWFEYDDYYCDSIASVMNKLEEIDEEGNELSKEKVNKYISCLEGNMEVKL
jgi:hypothetical protein